VQGARPSWCKALLPEHTPPLQQQQQATHRPSNSQSTFNPRPAPSLNQRPPGDTTARTRPTSLHVRRVLAAWQRGRKELVGARLVSRLQAVRRGERQVLPKREFFIDNLLVRIHVIIVMIRWTGLAPWEFEFHTLHGFRVQGGGGRDVLGCGANVSFQINVGGAQGHWRCGSLVAGHHHWAEAKRGTGPGGGGM